MCRFPEPALYFDGKFSVLFMHKGMIGICQDNVTTELMQTLYLNGQLDMIFFAKLLFGVTLEICKFRNR